MTPARILPPRPTTHDTTPARQPHWERDDDAEPYYKDKTGELAVKRAMRGKWKPKPHQAVRHIRRGRQ